VKIVHIGPDSPFTQYLGNKFEQASPGSNIFIVLTQLSRAEHPIGGALNIATPPNGLGFLGSILPAANKADAIVAHGLSRPAAMLMGSMKNPVKIWSGWGFDYYGRDSNGGLALLAKVTAMYADEHNDTSSKFSVRRLLGRVDRRLKARAVASMDYFSAPIPADYDVMRSTYPEFSGEYLQLNYGDVATMFSAGVKADNGSNILVGNSASLTNNHEDLFIQLARCDLTGRKVIVPLSYGDPAYRDHVIKSGEHYFGRSFFPLVDFMPLAEYVGVISSCNVVLMGHKRQQALGNIGSAIYHGAHLYLDRECPTYSFLRSRGVGVSALDELGRVLPRGRQPDVDLERSRHALHDFWGEDVVMRNVEDCVSLIKKHRALLSGAASCN
jgi:hypothetical protein